ncbi:MAG TPA: nucleotidyltransferase domain-containing protein [Phycisphaerae bacterium]|nr:nucleotidyltransferase domain-containing protein [Phycisphaerae bacterium]
MIPLLKDKSDELTRLCRNFGVARLEVFGSAAEDSRFDPSRSDVDFLVEFAPEAEGRLAELYLDLIAALRDLLGRDVDVVMTRAIRNPYFRQVVNRSRRTLYAA